MSKNKNYVIDIFLVCATISIIFAFTSGVYLGIGLTLSLIATILLGAYIVLSSVISLKRTNDATVQLIESIAKATECHDTRIALEHVMIMIEAEEEGL